LLGQQAKDIYGAAWAQQNFLKKFCGVSAVCEQGLRTQHSMQTTILVCVRKISIGVQFEQNFYPVSMFHILS